MPMGGDTYLRLFERVNAWFWPWHFLTLGVGFVVFLLLLRGREKLAWPLLGSMWVLVGVLFHWAFFAELNWAAVYFGWGFLVQGALLSLMFFRGEQNRAVGLKPSQWLGVVLMIAGLLVYPLLSPLLNQGWQQAQVFGVAPNPTGLFTIGAILLSKHKAWWLLPLPILWCLIGGATAYSLY